MWSIDDAMQNFDVIVLGAGAAGLMCAAEAGRRRRRVLLLDHGKRIGEKIRISGGGRCNFTNLHVTRENFLSSNPYFCVSALKRYTATDFIAKVEARGITYHEKTLGQLFCDGSAQQIIDMLLDDVNQAGVCLVNGQAIDSVSSPSGGGYEVAYGGETFRCTSLVIATGGKSIPKIGATGLGYQIAQQFGIPVVTTRPGLVALLFDKKLISQTNHLSGVSLDAVVIYRKVKFREGLLFTHKGLSGPSILQISSYLHLDDEIMIDLFPDRDMGSHLIELKRVKGRQSVENALAHVLPRRLAGHITQSLSVQGNLADHSNRSLTKIAEAINAWRVKPVGNEGYRTAEVTVGGVDTNALNSRTMECQTMPGLYFIGEVVDVTGWLGGYNFQWAWSSGWAAGQAV